MRKVANMMPKLQAKALSIFADITCMTPARTDKLLRVLKTRQCDLTVVLENVLDPHNVSAVMRTCDAVGVQDLHILSTRVARPKNWGFKSSSSASKWLTIHYHESATDCIVQLRKRYSRILCADAGEQALDLYAEDLTQPTAIIFGNELEGVGEDTRLLCDGILSIPQTGIIHSLNISVACAVILYEAYRQKKLAGHYKRDDLSLPEKQQLQELWGIRTSEAGEKLSK